MSSEILTVREAAARIKVSESTVRGWVRENILPATVVCRPQIAGVARTAVRLDWDRLVEWMHQDGAKARLERGTPPEEMDAELDNLAATAEED